ncbi:hypothetical protein [Amycolatopsis sp. cmx-11-51]
MDELGAVTATVSEPSGPGSYSHTPRKPAAERATVAATMVFFMIGTP